MRGSGVLEDVIHSECINVSHVGNFAILSIIF